MDKFKVYNGFGIMPSKNYTAAGYDFFVPNIDSSNEIVKTRAWEAFKKSYNKTDEELEYIYNELSLNVSSIYGEDKWNEKTDFNILMLFLSLDADYSVINDDDIDKQINEFIAQRLIISDDNIPGIEPMIGDYLFINSGIKTKFECGSAGIFFNKSGRGTKGWDIRACVVDEDYTGYVHLSLSYDKINNIKARIYCGDKLTQMVIFNLPKTEIIEVDEQSFIEAHEGSKRGDDGFGSSDNKK